MTSAPFGAGAVAAHAVRADGGLEMLLKAEIDQRVQPVDGLDPDVAASAAIAAVGSTELDEFLAPEGDAARAAVTRLDIDFAWSRNFMLRPSLGIGA